MTPTPDIWQVLAQDAAPFIVIAYILIDHTRRMERVLMAAISLMRHCDCTDSGDKVPVNGA